MAATTYGAITLAMLDELVEKVGKDSVITAEEAERIFGAKHDCQVGDLTRPQLLQLALFEAYAIIVDLTAKRPVAPNRAARRKTQ